MRCSVCSEQMLAAESGEYPLGPLRGRLCLTCQQGLTTAVGRWLAERLEQATRERVERERLEAEMMPRGRLMGVRMVRSA